MTLRRWRLGLCAVAVAVLALTQVAACTKAIGGSASPAPGAVQDSSLPSQPRAAADPAPDNGTQDLLGDLTNLDACSLTDPDEFSQFGTAKFGIPDALDECLIEIKSTAEEPIRVYIGRLASPDAFPNLDGNKANDLGGGLRVVEYDAEPTYCNHLLVFTDRVTLSVNAGLYSGPEPRLCDVVRAGMDKVVKVIQLGGVKHRRFPQNSLARHDPCDQMPQSALAAIPELAGVKPTTQPSRHNCVWMSADTNTRVRVMFTAGTPPTGGDPIGGRPSVVTPTSNAGQYVFCGVQTAHIPFSFPGQEGLVEIAGVFVRKPKGQTDAACKMATDLAGAVWPTLPKP
jgi:hypothetical protein